LPDVPVVVITSMRQDPDNIASDEVNGSSRQGLWDAHEQLKNGVTDFTHIATVNSGHDIMWTESNLITGNVKLLISKLP